MSSEQKHTSALAASADDSISNLGPPYDPQDSPNDDPAPSKAFLSLPLQSAPYANSTHSVSSISLGDILPVPKAPLWARLKLVAYNNRGIMLVLLSQFFGSLMNLATRVLETSFPEQRFHALQILFARQSITSVLVWVWLWWCKVEHAPFGQKGVRGLLVARAVGGFFGVFGLYYSLSYLDLSDATVITFLSPIVASVTCSLIPSLKEPFTRTNLFASLVSLAGVVLIARPTALFTFSTSGSDGYDETLPSSPSRRGIFSRATISPQGSHLEVTPHQRLVAVLVALLGVFGAASAFTTIRWIGKRAHPLLSVNYFSTWCMIVSLVCLLSIPSVGGIIWPRTVVQWMLLLGIGVSGFVMQFLLTAGLQVEKASRATNMVYAQMLFALFWERVVWGTTPGALSIAGSTLVLGSVIWVGVKKDSGKKEVRVDEEGAPVVLPLAERYSEDEGEGELVGRR